MELQNLKISAINFRNGKKKSFTTIHVSAKYTPEKENDIATISFPLKNTMARKGSFDRAMDKMKVHLLVRLGFAEPVDRLGKPIEAEYFNEHIFEDDPRFEGIDITGIVITTKNDSTGFKIMGTQTTEDGAIAKLTSPVISTIIGSEGWNYPLAKFAVTHLSDAIEEAKDYIEKSQVMSRAQLKIAI